LHKKAKIRIFAVDFQIDTNFLLMLQI